MSTSRSTTWSARRRLQILVAAPSVLFLTFTVANPYLGLRTTGAITMVSNIRTEAGDSNHLVGTLRLAGYQDDLMLVTGSNLGILAEAAKHGESIPLASLHGWSEIAGPATWVTGEIDGEAVRWTPTDVDLVGESTFFERYLLSFRSTDPEALHHRCTN